MNKLLVALIIYISLATNVFAGEVCPVQTPVNDVYSTNQDIELVIKADAGVLANDTSDNGVKGIDFTNSGLVLPRHGSLVINPDGSFIYTPESGYFGPDSFTYQTNNGCTHSDGSAIVSITINPKNTPPTITLTGDNPLYLNVGDDIPLSAGANANDAEDGDITFSIQINSNLVKNTPGKYKIQYSVSDKMNATSSDTRIVFVGAVTENTKELCTDGVDNDFDGKADAQDPNCKSFYNTAPTITLLGDNPKTIFVGDKYVEAGATATDTEDGPIASSSISISGTVGTSTGTYLLNYSVQDSGNLFGYATRTILVATTTENTAAKCSDGIDNDGDGKIDLADSDCAAFIPAPAPVSTGGGGGGGGFVAPTIIQPNATQTAFTTKQVGQVLGAETSCGIYLNLGKDYLARGHKNNIEKLILLKKFLNKNLELKIDLNEFYGPQTEKAVKDFQMKYKDKILDPWGIKKATGKVYLTTANQINYLECPSLGTTIRTKDLKPIQ